LDIVEVAEQQLMIGDERLQIVDARIGGDRLNREFNPPEPRLSVGGERFEPGIGELTRSIEHQRPAGQVRETDQGEGQHGEQHRKGHRDMNRQGSRFAEKTHPLAPQKALSAVNVASAW
jgi:hypothetical protein